MLCTADLAVRNYALWWALGCLTASGGLLLDASIIRPADRGEWSMGLSGITGIGVALLQTTGFALAGSSGVNGATCWFTTGLSLAGLLPLSVMEAGALVRYGVCCILICSAGGMWAANPEASMELPLARDQRQTPGGRYFSPWGGLVVTLGIYAAVFAIFPSGLERLLTPEDRGQVPSALKWFGEPGPPVGNAPGAALTPGDRVAQHLDSCFYRGYAREQKSGPHLYPGCRGQVPGGDVWTFLAGPGKVVRLALLGISMAEWVYADRTDASLITERMAGRSWVPPHLLPLPTLT
jgi:hypothetical protein